jgi:DNA polymerase-4
VGTGAEASILHADLDAFFASVEQRDDPSLRGRPIAVGGGVVLAASYEAKAFGVHGAMGGAEARRRCPHLVFVPPRFHAYVDASRAVFDVFRDTTPDVEGLSIDEAFLHVGGLGKLVGPPAEVARRLRESVRVRTGLTITVGVARTRFLAKVASGVAKPDGLLLVPPDGELDFLRPLPIGALWGFGPASTRTLARVGIETVADMADVPEASLVALLGRAAGHHLYAVVHSRDRGPIYTTASPNRSVGSQSALGRARTEMATIDPPLAAAVDRVTRRLRSADQAGRTVTVRLRFGDFKSVTRSHTLANPTAQTRLVLETARMLLHAESAAIATRGLTLVGVAVSNLDSGVAHQLELPLDERSPAALDTAMDGIRDRFGSSSLTRAVLLSGRSGTFDNSVHGATAHPLPAERAGRDRPSGDRRG